MADVVLDLKANNAQLKKSLEEATAAFNKLDNAAKNTNKQVNDGLNKTSASAKTAGGSMSSFWAVAGGAGIAGIALSVLSSVASAMKEVGASAIKGAA